MFESTQSRILSSISILVLLLGLLVNGLYMGLGSSILFIIVFSIGTLISIFDINCTINGGCTIFSWIKTIILLISLILLTVSYGKILGDLNLKEKENNKKKEIPYIKVVEPTRIFDESKNTLEEFYNLLK
jgi:hypothetical protein